MSILQAFHRKALSRKISITVPHNIEKCCKSLETTPLGQLGGRICAVVDLDTRLPVDTWCSQNPY
ncbi:hypothetical protein PN466_08940 [Roseofilum reptotaenium CS-1145]|nr:hypothetical protein [Roseofilum reptotaenium CS-1145]